MPRLLVAFAAVAADVRFGLRMLARKPGHTAAAALALGLGIGLTTTVFSIIDGSILRPLPFERAERILHLETNNLAKGEPSLEVFIPDFLDWRERQTSFEGLAGFYEGTVNLSGDERPERFDGAFLTADTFDLLRARPLLGRGFLPGEDSLQAPPVVVLSWDVWQTRYGGGPDVVGKPVRINGEAGTIVGVMPQGFKFPISQQVWVPLRKDPLKEPRGEGITLEVIGRLKDGVTLEQARAEMSGIARALAAEHPQTNEGVGAVVKPFTEEYVGEAALLLYTMLGAVFLVLLIACANVAGLMVARAAQRTRELAIRSALGAGRRRVLTQILTEGLLVALLGALLGGLFTVWGVRWFLDAIAPSNPPFWFKIELDLSVLAFAAGVTILSGLLSALVPALQASRADVGEVLKDEGRGSSSLRLGLFSKLIVIGEVALSCALLVSSGLMIKSVWKLRTLDPGFAAGEVLTVRVALFESAYPEVRQRVAFFEDLLARLAVRPGVAAVAAGSSLPFTGSSWERYAVEGRAYAQPKDMPSAHRAMVSPGYFRTFGQEVLAGRDFGREDTAASLPVALVNQSFAAKVWPRESPLGRRIRFGREGEEPWRTVVGVVADLGLNSIDPEDLPEGVYLPLAQQAPSFVSVALRTPRGGPAPLSLVPLLRKEVGALDPDLPVYFAETMAQILARGAFFPNLFATLFAFFGASALLLAAVGIYGIIAFSVARRTQEIGIRMALGAERKNVLRLVLRQGMVQLAIGLAVGLAGAVLFGRLLAGFLYQVDAADPGTFATVAATLALVALLACLLPARRASRVDPLVAIRYE